MFILVEWLYQCQCLEIPRNNRIQIVEKLGQMQVVTQLALCSEIDKDHKFKVTE